jgi:hypothetical protein
MKGKSSGTRVRGKEVELLNTNVNNGDYTLVKKYKFPIREIKTCKLLKSVQCVICNS